jgi:hypothetical protein
MDLDVKARFASADSTEIDVPFPALEIAVDVDGKPVSVGAEVRVAMPDGDTTALVLRPTRELFAGSAPAPDLSRGPTPKLEPFFLLLEFTVVRFCELDGRDQTDQDMETIFAELRRRPDGKGGRLFTHLRAASRLYLSLREVSEAEYTAVMARLTRSARTFAMAPISRNYLATLRDTFAG